MFAGLQRLPQKAEISFAAAPPGLKLARRRLRQSCMLERHSMMDDDRRHLATLLHNRLDSFRRNARANWRGVQHYQSLLCLLVCRDQAWPRSRRCRCRWSAGNHHQVGRACRLKRCMIRMWGCIDHDKAIALRRGSLDFLPKACRIRPGHVRGAVASSVRPLHRRALRVKIEN